MKDIRAVLSEKEAEYRRVGTEVNALRIAFKLLDDQPAAQPPAAQPAEEKKDGSEPVKAWP